MCHCRVPPARARLCGHHDGTRRSSAHPMAARSPECTGWVFLEVHPTRGEGRWASVPLCERRTYPSSRCYLQVVAGIGEKHLLIGFGNDLERRPRQVCHTYP